MNNSQSIQDQLNQEFDRIFWSFKGSTSNTSAIGRIVIDTLYFMKCSLLDYSFETCGENTKREILAAIFLAKDDQGEYILKEGDLVNPKLSRTLTLHDIETKFMDAAMTIKINDGEWQKVNLINFIMQGSKIFHLPKNFRELFKQNCFAETQEEIDNLKLINW